MKLHLGCGQHYLDGYVNIDFPSSAHTVQERIVADLESDILELRYQAESIEEIRLHHVFEHFPRPIACSLLACWFSWLKQGGIIHIEVPDFQRTSLVLLNPFASFKNKAVAERHLFGSHEAHWAVHCEGYSSWLMAAMLESFRFRVSKVRRNSCKGTFNFEILANKSAAVAGREDFEEVSRTFLRNFLVDDSEQRLLDVWMEKYRSQVERSWASSS
jgi:hypothetical protein